MHISGHSRKVFLHDSAQSLAENPEAQLITRLLRLTIDIIKELRPTASTGVNELLKLSLRLHKGLLWGGAAALHSRSLHRIAQCMNVFDNLIHLSFGHNCNISVSNYY